MKVLECSSIGDKRFSAFYAIISVNGEIRSIEHHYQLSKRFIDSPPPVTIKQAKGREPNSIMIGNVSLGANFLTQWYKLLWVKYLDYHPELVEYASQFDEFTDKFRGGSKNCQADVVKQYVKEGRESVIADCEQLLTILVACQKSS